MPTLTSNQLKSSTINVSLTVVDYESIQGSATIQRNLTVGGYFLPNGGIQIDITNITSGIVTTYYLTPAILSYLSNISSDVQNQLSLLAPLNNPFFTGNPTCITQSSSDNSTNIATTSFVQSLVSGKISLSDILNNNNTWIGTNEFNTSLPTSTLTPLLN